MEMEIIVAVKEENVMPENWRPASEMRALVTSYDNSVTKDVMDGIMCEIEKRAKHGEIDVRFKSYCGKNVSEIVVKILQTLGYTVKYDYFSSSNAYVFDIHW